MSSYTSPLVKLIKRCRIKCCKKKFEISFINRSHTISLSAVDAARLPDLDYWNLVRWHVFGTLAVSNPRQPFYVISFYVICFLFVLFTINGQRSTSNVNGVAPSVAILCRRQLSSVMCHPSPILHTRHPSPTYTIVSASRLYIEMCVVCVVCVSWLHTIVAHATGHVLSTS